MTTRGGANSGNTSTRMFGTWAIPNTMMPRAAATTRNRKRKLPAMTERIRVWPPRTVSLRH